MDEQLQIDISLSSPLNIGDKFTLFLHDNEGWEIIVSQTAVERRLGPNQIEVGPGIDLTLSNLKKSLKLDYSNLFDFDNIESGVKLISKIPGLNYSDKVVYPLNLPISFNPQIVPVVNYKINSIEFLESTVNPCGNVTVKVTTNEPTAQYCINGNCVQVNSPVFEFDYYRGATLLLELSNYVGAKLFSTIQTPPLIETSNESIRLVVTNSTSGGSVNVIYPATDLLIYEFSLDNLNWQTSNGYYGLPDGDYNLYVRDQYGCVKILGFSILENNFPEPVRFISKENSIRFVEPIKQYDTDENRAFCMSPAKLNYGYIQEFLRTDIITTQFRSNYKTIAVSVFNLTDNTVDLVPVSKLTHNIGLKSKYNQAKKYKISSSQFGIYFENGQIIDYDTNAVIDTYSLNGGLPIWATLGNIIKINGVDYQISSVGYDENVNAEVLIFNGSASATVENVIVSCLYNIHDYEVYEFVIDMSLYLDKEFKIEISNGDPNFGNYTWKSEKISVVEVLPNYLEIRYYNSTNTNVIYSSGIEHLLRIPYNTIKAVDSDTNESYKTDTNTHLLNSDVYEITDFEFIPLPLELFRKLKIALSMDNVFIDGVGYTKNAEFQKENLGSTNLYKLTASMIKNGYVFNSNKNIVETLTDANINIPGLTQITSDGYLSL